MLQIRNIPIQRKLRVAILATCTAALCVASSALFALQYYFFQRDFKRDLVSVAQMIENLSGPTISLGHPEETEIFLNALNTKPHVTGACIRLPNGEICSLYGNLHDLENNAKVQVDGFHTLNGELVYVRPVMDDEQRVGTLVLVSDYRATSGKLHGLYAAILVAVLGLSFLVAVIVSSKLERLICGPILALADTARKIATRGDYSVRALKRGHDEVGDFTDTFNLMLSQIEQREAALEHEIAERLRTESELQETHERLMAASHQAGMAEVATGVLHNVGNVLNSVNVSASLISEKINDPRHDHLVRATRMLREQNGNVSEFLTADPKGKLLPGYMADASEHLAQSRAEAQAELELLTKNIEHIKDIVARQQTYARVSGVVESVSLEELVDDSLRMNADDLERFGIKVVCKYDHVPLVLADKHKVLQIGVNLIRNAINAIHEAEPPRRQITIRLYRKDADTVGLRVVDTGVGIAEENLTRIFSHGFTTRQSGHGFGLHSAALAAQQMNGRLLAESSGAGQGATFTLELPVAASPSRQPFRAVVEMAAPVT